MPLVHAKWSGATLHVIRGDRSLDVKATGAQGHFHGDRQPGNVANEKVKSRSQGWPGLIGRAEHMLYFRGGAGLDGWLG